ncbi:hypothetical protein WJX81_008058 [Elliptochloris bilobata]|uniref:Protein KTI12 homolog n=1 Tax=Elliptochloris bilobata TaxID=381761 RepID=A0AAW1QN39_9CHLO
MPLVVLCGQPCTGKSTVAAALAEVLRSKGLEVEVLSETSLHLERDASYGDVPSEKRTRGLLRSTVDRRLSKRAVLIVDSLNNIKGYRYELWCIARTVATRYCLLHCDVLEATARAWNDARRAAGAPCYSAAVFEDLARRFETPSTRNRWDMPLVLQEVAAALSDAPAPARSGVVARELTPNLATALEPVAATNLLAEVNRASQDVIAAVTHAQALAAGGPAGRVELGAGVAQLELARPVGPAELRRHKRDFIRLATQSGCGVRLGGRAAAMRSFADYLRGRLEAG